MRTVFWQPRFGLAYSVTQSGNTVIRGGWGRFYYHSGQFTAGLDTSAGSASVTLTPNSIGNQPLLLKNLNSIPFTATPPAPSAVDSRDDRQPHTDSYSFTISQRLPWSSLLEVAYVGNQSTDLQNTAGAGSNINLVPVRAMLGQVNPATANPDQFRPIQGYQDINLATNNLYSNYNALQVTWARQKGRYVIQANYSFQKAMGIVSPNGGQATLDPFDLSQNYGVQPGDRRHLFNISYSLELGSPLHGNRIAQGVINNWQLSGITTVESGANLTYNSGTSDRFNMQLNGAILPGSISTANPQGIAIGNQSILGTNAIQLNPIITCNPLANLGPHQYINGSCFAPPTQVGVNGPTLLPAFYGPAFFNWDLGLFKNFPIKEKMKLQFRLQMYNWMNHPLWSFPNGNNLTLQFNQGPNGGPITQTNSSFGTTTVKQGNRVIELAVKFYF